MDTVIYLLATYTLTYLFTQTDGPLGIFYRLRKKFTDLFTCFYCLSVYSGFLIALLTTQGIKQIFIYTFGLAGGAIIIYKLGENYGK